MFLKYLRQILLIGLLFKAPGFNLTSYSNQIINPHNHYLQSFQLQSISGDIPSTDTKSSDPKDTNTEVC